MTIRSALVLILLLSGVSFVPAAGRAANEPVASAPIPPPPMTPAPYVVPSTVAAARKTVPPIPRTTMAKPGAPPIAQKRRAASHAAAHGSIRHARREPHRFAVRPAEPPPMPRRMPRERRYYAGDLPPGALGDEPPPLPPWYRDYPGPWRRAPPPW